MTTTQTIWCCGCSKDVEARLTSGAEIRTIEDARAAYRAAVEIGKVAT